VKRPHMGGVYREAPGGLWPTLLNSRQPVKRAHAWIRPYGPTPRIAHNRRKPAGGPSDTPRTFLAGTRAVLLTAPLAAEAQQRRPCHDGDRRRKVLMLAILSEGGLVLPTRSAGWW